MIKIELYSNPFVNVLPFCSNCDLDLHFNGINNIDSLDPVQYESMLLIDPRPPIFYLKNMSKFKKVFIFGNIPPTIFLKNAIVYTYFHNVLLLQRKHFLNIESIVHNLKSFIFQYLKKNTNFSNKLGITNFCKI